VLRAALAQGAQWVKQSWLCSRFNLRHIAAMKFSSRILLSTLFLALACAKGPAQPAAAPLEQARPALWKLADADTTIYLFGTIHALPKDFTWTTTALKKAIAKSSALVLEVGDLNNDAKAASIFRRLAISPNLPPLLDRVPSEKRARLGVMLDAAGIPQGSLDSMESWAATVALAATMLSDLGVSPEYGVEEQLSKTFRAAKKPIAGLETTEQQLGFFDKLSDTAQSTFLISMIDESADASVEFKSMVDAWARGDDKAIAITFDDELKLSPELADVLIRKRNANWTEWLTKRLKRPGTILVAVGAGHLAGDDSLQVMLAKRGLTVTRIQ
jgi:uncharacterized protein